MMAVSGTDAASKYHSFASLTATPHAEASIRWEALEVYSTSFSAPNVLWRMD
jgi:hypothetical protein